MPLQHPTIIMATVSKAPLVWIDCEVGLIEICCSISLTLLDDRPEH